MPSALGAAALEPLPGGWRFRGASALGAGLRVEGPWDWSGAACLSWAMEAAINGRIRVTVSHGRGEWAFYVVPKPGLHLRVAVAAADLAVRPANTPRPGYFTFGDGPVSVDLADVRAVTWVHDQDGAPVDLAITELSAPAAQTVPSIRSPHVTRRRGRRPARS